MFLRRHRKHAAGETYEYWTLCESRRTAAGPRQQVVATLGKLTDEEAREEAGWEQLESLLDGRPAAPRQLPLGASPQTALTGPRWEVVDVRGVRVERARDFGEAFLGLALWRRLGLHTLLAQLIEPGEEEVPWPTVASVLAVARFCGQRSELGIAERWYAHSAMEDLLGVSWEKINDDRLYRGLDVLGAHKDQLCAHLMERYRSWFGVQFEFLLYDVTSTFFEGQAEKNEKAARGYSRDSRPDCKQVCIGLVCTPEGLPLSYEVFAGNRTDVTTVEEIVRTMEEKYGQAQRVWVMDRGMVSEKNIEFLRARGARYLVGTPKSQLRQFEAAFLEKEGWSEVQSGLEAKLVAHPDGKGEEQFILCRSSARGQKEAAMLARQSDALCEELAKIDRALAHKPQADLEAVGRRIGRWLGRYPAAAKVLDILVRHDGEGRACGLTLSCPLAPGQWAAHTQGAYLLRTNCPERDPAQLWRWYIQLTQAEAAFRTAKSDLGLRPIYHQSTARVEAHILVCFLALAMWRTLEMWMHGKGLGTCARRLVEEVATIKSMDVLLPVRRGEQIAQLRLRCVARPERRVAELLVRLGLDLPTRSRIVEDLPAAVLENVVQKTDA
ncbi:MAG: IS1634 family transposase [Usitatibacter sp.]